MKSIRLTIEWDGAASEEAYAAVIASDIETGDISELTRVTKIEHLTHLGKTDRNPIGEQNRRKNLAKLRPVGLFRWLREWAS